MNEIIHLDTDKTSYIVGILPTGHVCNLYYGKKIRKMNDYSCLFQNNDVPYGTMVNVTQEFKELGLDDQCLEYSGLGKGDYREPAVEIVFDDGSRTTDFRFVSTNTFSGKKNIPGLPSSLGTETDVTTTEIILCDKEKDIEITLSYCVYAKCNIISRFATIKNKSEKTIHVNRLLSMQLDIFGGDWQFITFDGCWAFEREKNVKDVLPGIYINDSKTGNSSNRHNPFVMIADKKCDEFSGTCYGSNLIYSGCHAEILECTYTGKVRLLSGINPSNFDWELKSNEEFTTPEAVLSFSDTGFNDLSHNFHVFTENFVVPKQWQHKERPVLINNWEATDFDFDKNKILSLAKEGAKLGMELFVLDDGWFGKRNDDTSSLGDWFVNKKKLPGGIGELASSINKLGMKFGLWVEPEMINEDSDLYRAHPDWAISIPGRAPAYGRNQFVLDLTIPEVRKYLIDVLSDIFSSANIEYIKWDMNRNISDAYSKVLPPEKQGEFHHRYILGLYEILDALVNKFPDILFESCASGGNRFDLGMLSYMPQTWTSDDTDAFARLSIQGGTSYAYPPSTMGAHVSASPNMQTLHSTPIESRFNTASFGLLGYELDLTMLSDFDKKAIQAQVEFYKAHRKLMQFGRFYRVPNKLYKDRIIWAVVSEDGKEAMAGLFQGGAKVGKGHDVLTIPNLNPELDYAIEGRAQFINVKAFGNLVNRVLPVKIKGDGVIHTVLSSHYMFEMIKENYKAGGDLLSNYGIKLLQQFSGTGYNDKIRIFSDYGSRLYYVKAE